MAQKAQKADSRESGATGLELTTSYISRGVVFRRVEGPEAPGSLSYLINWLSCVDLHVS